MYPILLFTVIGFLAGFILVIARRRIKLDKILGAAFLGLLLASISKIIKNSIDKKGRKS